MADGFRFGFGSSACSFEFSEYVKSLDLIAKSRYTAKLTYAKGSCSLPDPYSLKGWQNNPSSWPDVTFGDIYTYLIDTPDIYTKESLKAFKSLEAYHFFVSGHVKMLWYHCIGNEVPFCFIKGKIIPSQRINNKPHDAWVCLDKKEASVYCAHCTCMAGLGEVCSHIAAILFKIEAGVRLGLTKTSCTDEACQWNKTFREKLNPLPLAEVQNLTKRNRKQQVKAAIYSRNTPLPDESELESLKEVCPSAVFFDLIPKLDPEETDSASEDEDEADLPQPLTSLYNAEYTNLDLEELSKKCDDVWSDLEYSVIQRQNLEIMTREQSVCPLWFEHRNGRITASRAHLVFHRRDTTSPDNLIKTIMGYSSKDISSRKEVKWGVDNENTAREEYIKAKERAGHEDFKCRLSGLVIDPGRPYLGATADGIASCKCCSLHVVEIKCPYKYRKNEPLEVAATNNDPDFCLNERGELKRNHRYYTQVQVQMHVNEIKLADFCVYTKSLYIVKNIKYDLDFMQALLPKTDLFFAGFILPELLTRSLESNEEDEEEDKSTEEQLYCVCNKPGHGKMIACGNPNCDIVWFHYECVNIRRKPRVKWFCSQCKHD